MIPHEAEIEEGLDALFREWEAEHAQSFREEGKRNFELERITSYFRSSSFDPKIPRRIAESKKICKASPAASLILSYSCIEIALKRELFTPIVYAFTTSDNIARYFARHIVRAEMPPKHLSDLVDGFLAMTIGFDTNNIELGSSKKTLWEHINYTRDLRNKTTHDTFAVSKDQANQASDLAQYVVDRVCRRLRNEMQTWVE